MYSYSAIKDFKQCPFMYHAKRVEKRIKFAETAATRHGTALHAAFEHYVRDGTPLPLPLLKHEPLLQVLMASGDQLLVEHEMAVDMDCTPVPYYDPAKPDPKPWDFNPNAFIGGKADIIRLVPSENKGMYFDYKTGKGNYPDMHQCELMSILLMAQNPWMESVDAALLFVEAGKVLSKTYLRADMERLWEGWLQIVSNILYCHQSGGWSRRPSALCNYCQVRDCPEAGGA